VPPLLALLLAACQGPAAPPPAAQDAATLAAQALERGDYARAADLYRQALAGAPESVPLHYGLGVATSHLNRREDTIREFRWVLERGRPGSPEVEGARRWLAAAGALPAAGGLAAPAAGSDQGREAGQASLEGRVLFAEAGQSPAPLAYQMLFLKGLDRTPTADEYHRIRSDEGGRFRFPSVAPGPYMLTDAIAGRVRWRLKVELRPGQEMVLDLTPANTIQSRDDFPNRG
jgi:hypothetical protein